MRSSIPAIVAFSEEESAKL